MDAEELIKEIATYRIPKAAKQTLEILSDRNRMSESGPEGRLASDWFMENGDRQAVETIVRLGINSFFFDLLCIFDGVNFVEDSQDKGDFEIWYSRGGERHQLNQKHAEMLHDIFRGYTDLI